MPFKVFLLLLSTLGQLEDISTPSALFQIERLAMTLEPEKQILIKSTGKDEVVFHVSFSGTIDAAARIMATLVGPGLDAGPYPIDVPASERRLAVPSSVFQEEGTYQLLNVRLELGGQVVSFATPDRAEVRVAENVLVTGVQVRDLSQSELLELGYIFDKGDFHTVEFTLSLVMDSQEIPVTVPVAFPRTEQKGFLPKVLKDPFNAPVHVTPMITWKTTSESTPNLLTTTDVQEDANYVLSLLVIPGRLNYLKNHFSVTCLAMNSAPEGYDVRIGKLKAKLRLPSPQAIGYPLTLDESPVKEMLAEGEDGQPGTGDDRDSIDPGEEAKAQYIVTGEIEGIYDVAVDVTGVIELPSETLNVRSVAHGRVLVRHPDFTVTMEHPDAVAENESYDFFMHFANRGEVDIEGLSVELDPDRLIGVALDQSDPIQPVGTMVPGGEATVRFRFRSKITGQVVASYFKVEGDVPGTLRLSVGVAPTGERISPYVVAFSQKFFDYLPADLSSSLKRYAKKLFDFSQMTESELPTGVHPVNPTAVRGLNQWMASTVESRDFGVSGRDADVRLLSVWLSSFKGYAPVDLLRRKFESEAALELERQFGELLSTHFSATASEEVVSAIANQNPEISELLAMVVDSDSALEIALLDADGNETNLEGQREIPFAAAIPLGPTRTLVWKRGREFPRLRLGSPNGLPVGVRISAVLRGEGYDPNLIADRALTISAPTWLDFQEGAIQVSGPDGLLSYWNGIPLDQTPFLLTTAQQVDSGINGFHDLYGRHCLFGFSKPLDLASLEPLEEHVFLNGQPAVDALLQSDSRFVIVSSRMPLGPYVPIRYELRGARDIEGNPLETLTGIVTPSSQYFGVRAAGKVVDHGGGRLVGARVFLWQKFTGYMFRSGTYLNEISQMVDNVDDPLLGPYSDNPFIKERYLVLAETALGADGTYGFDFIAFNPFATATTPDVTRRTLRQFKIGIELPDGRYEEREFFPKGVGQEITADFAFGYKGEIFGQVVDGLGEPIPFVPVFIINQAQITSGDIVTADASGFYRTENVQVGPVLVKSQAGQSVGLASGYLTAQNTPLRLDVRVAEPSATIEGHVYAVIDGLEIPLSGVFVGATMDSTFETFANEYSYGLTANVGVRTGADGSYRLENVPARLGNLRFFHPNFGLAKVQVTLTEDTGTLLQNHYYHGADTQGGSISGNVVDEFGNAVPGARVMTPWQSTLADGTGAFYLEGIPLNTAVTVTGRDGDGARVGRLFLTLDATQPDLTGQTLELSLPREASGTYANAEGAPLPFAAITFIPNSVQTAGAIEVSYTDAQGRWSLALAPELSGTNGTFVALDPPFLAYTARTIAPTGNDGIQIKRVPSADVTVRLLDAGGQPVIGTAFLESRVANLESQSLGLPKTRLVKGITSIDGRYVFPKANLDGNIKIWGESLLLGTTQIFNQELFPPEPGDPPLEIALAFTQADLGALFGQVLDSDGVSPAPPGSYVHVTIDSAIHAQAPVDSNGFYSFDALVETGTPKLVKVVAYNGAARRFAEDFLVLNKDLRFRHDMVLGSKGSVAVSVEDAGGTRPAFAAVELSYRKLVFDEPAEPGEAPALGTVNTVSQAIQAQITPGEASVLFDGIPSGAFSVRAVAGAGVAGRRDYAMPRGGGQLDLTVQLEAASVIRGQFVDDQAQPITEAEVQLRLLEGPNPGLQQQMLTGGLGPDSGRFSFTDLPMRRYELYGVNPLDGLAGTFRVRTTPYVPEVDVTLRLDPVVDLEGVVYHQGDPLADAIVEIRGPTGFRLITGTDSQGFYRFANLVPAKYTMGARKLSVTARAAAVADLRSAGEIHELDLHTERTLDLEIGALLADFAPATKTLIHIHGNRYSNGSFTDENGTVSFQDLPLGTYRVTAQDPVTLAFLEDTVTLVDADPELAKRELVFNGWGSVTGQVVNSLGHPLERPVDILFTYTTIDGLAANLSHEVKTRAVTTDGDGRFRLYRVATGERVLFQAWDPVTHESASGELEIQEHGQEVSLPIVFRAHTSVGGTVLYADGTPAPGVEVWAMDPVLRVVQSDTTGRFTMEPVREGTVKLYFREPLTKRQADVALDVTANGDGQLFPVDDFQVTLSGQALLRGQATYADGSPITSGQIELIDGEGRVEGSSIVLADGSYFMGPVPVGSFYLQATDSRFGHRGEPIPVDLNQDGGAYHETYVFEPDYELSGRILAVNGVDPVVDGWVTLWKTMPNGKAIRVYAAETNDQGYFSVERVFPGPYRIESGNDALTMTWSGSVILPDLDFHLPITLAPRSWSQGIVADANGTLFTEGTVEMSQFGRIHRQRLTHDGQFNFQNLQPTQYTLELSLAGGWVRHRQTGTLANGSNPLNIVIPETMEISGRIIGTEGDRPPTPFIYKGDVGRRLQTNGSGHFNLDHVPLGADLTLRLTHGFVEKSYPLGGIEAGGDIGSFYLDTSPPEITFANDGATVAGWDDIRFELSEPDLTAGSEVDSERTRVWLNGEEVTEYFQTSTSQTFPNFPTWPEAALRGHNQIEIWVFNTHNAKAQESFSFDVDAAGSTVVVDLTQGGQPAQGQARIGNGIWIETDAGGRAVFSNIDASSVTLKGRSGDTGLRVRRELGTRLAIHESMEMEPFAEYRGSVFDLNGMPAPGVEVRIADQVEPTDENGRFSFDLLPLGSHQVFAQAEDLFGHVQPEPLTLPRSVILNVNLQLKGIGVVEGFVYDEDGATPVSGAAITLNHPGLPNPFTAPYEPVATDSNGYFRLENVRMFPFEIQAYHIPSRRYARGEGAIQTNGGSEVLNLLLSPTGAFVGSVRNEAGLAVEGAAVSAEWRGVSSSTVTAADGSFVLQGLPRMADYHFRVLDRDGNRFYKNAHHLGQPVRDLGDLTLTPNLPPVLSHPSYPNPFDPSFPFQFTAQVNDDLALASVAARFSGAYVASERLDFTDRVVGATAVFRQDIPTTAQEGPLTVLIEATDILGSVFQQSFTTALRFDVIGPAMTVVEPIDNQSYLEGQPVHIEVAASDPQGVDRIEIRRNDQLVAIHDPQQNQVTFQFDIYAPDVVAASDIFYELRGYDSSGHQSIGSFHIHVQPIETFEPPAVRWLSPLPEMPLPIFLDGGLALPVAAEVSDLEGLASYRISINGDLVEAGSLEGSTALIETSLTVPPVLRGEDRLEIGLTVVDLGGQAWSQTRTVVNIEGLVFENGLTLNAWDSSFDGESIILAGGVHVIDGEHHLENLVLVNAAALTQTDTAEDESYVAGTDLQVSGHVVVGYGSSIDIDGKGYPRLPEALFMGDGHASHGGLAKDASDPGEAYGSPIQPVLPGSHRGGGALKIQASAIWMAGETTADAFHQDNWQTGSGGSVWLIASNFEGYGLVSANGYKTDFSDWNVTGGGGRVAIYGDFQGEVQAFGAEGAGAGTIYQRIPDGLETDGFHDRLLLANRQDQQLSNFTPVRRLRDIEIGADAVYQSLVVDNKAVGRLEFPPETPLPYGAFLGMRVYREDEFGLASSITHQSATLVQWEEGPTPNAFALGESVQLDYAFDQVLVLDQAQLHLMEIRPAWPVGISNAGLVSGEEEVDLQGVALSLEGDIRLSGSLRLDPMIAENGRTFILSGRFSTPAFECRDGVSILNGRVVADTIDILSNATLRTPDNTHFAEMELEAVSIRVDGNITAHKNGEVSDSTDASSYAHGGLPGGRTVYSNERSYGSAYSPNAQGRTNSQAFSGGRISLRFSDALIVDGAIDASGNPGSGDGGSGGSVLLQGGILAGAGTIRANAAANPISNTFPGGGRIAVKVSHTDAFTGNYEAFGKQGNGKSGGAGTVFVQTEALPHGRLLVDNNGHESLPDSTPLPGLGERIATQDTGGGPVVLGSDFPDDLTGLYLIVDGHDPVRIAGNTETELYPDAGNVFPPIGAGDAYRGRHILDELVVRGSANLKSIDEMDIRGTIETQDGAVNAPILQNQQVIANQTLTIDDPALYSTLVLDNSQVIAEVPLDLSELHLVNGSSFTYMAPMNVGELVLDGSQLQSAVRGMGISLDADHVRLLNGSVWTVADRPGASMPAYDLRAMIQNKVTVDATSTITTSGADKVSDAHLQWAGMRIESNSHGGYGRYSFSEGGGITGDWPVTGSFAHPVLQGTRLGGGAVEIHAGELEIQGKIVADGYLSGSGGSIWLQASLISGTGEVSARPGSGSNLGGGGRIAIHYGLDNSFRDTLSIVTRSLNPTAQWNFKQGTGTVFFKGADQAFGELVLDQGLDSDANADTASIRQRLTGIVGPKTLTLNLDDADPDPMAIEDPSWVDLPPGLAGLRARFEISGTHYDVGILANDYNRLVLESPVPNIVPAGTQIQLVLKLDRLTLKNGAQLFFEGSMEVDSLVLEGSYLNSVYACDLKLPETQLALDGKQFRLILTEPEWQAVDLALQDSVLYLDLPLGVRHVNLANSWIRHSKYYSSSLRSLVVPDLHLTADSLFADSSSGIDVSGTVQFNGPFGPLGHGGIASVDGGVYGSVFFPDSFGSGPSLGGGKLRITTQTLQGGNFLADGGLGAGGSVFIEAGTLSGTVAISADGGSNTTNAGGRIAVYGDASQADLSMSAVTPSRHQGHGGPGTIFLKGPQHNNGVLILDKGSAPGTDHVTPLPMVSPFLIEGGFSAAYDAVSDLTQWLVPGLDIAIGDGDTEYTQNYAGYWAMVNDEKSRRHRIIESKMIGNVARFFLQGDASGVQPGDTVRLAVALDGLQLCGDCELDLGDLALLDDQDPAVSDFALSPVDSSGRLSPGIPFGVSFEVVDNFALKGVAVSFNGETQPLSSGGPYQATFTAPAPAVQTDYPLSVRVTDYGGFHHDFGFISTVAEADSEPPSLAILAPADPAEGYELETLAVVISASDNRLLDRVETELNGQIQVFQYDGTNQGENASFNYTLPEVAVAQAMTLSAVAYDGAGLSASAQIQISVQPDLEAPVAVIAEPGDSATFGPLENFNLVMTATDNRVLASVQCHFDGQTQSHAFHATNQTEPVTFNLLTPSPEQGQIFPITVEVADLAGNVGTAQVEISVQVDEGGHFPRPTHYWTFDTADLSQSYLDLVGGAHANYDSSSSQAGVFGQAGYFSNSSHKMEVDGEPSLDFLDAVTVSLWIKANNFQANGGILIYGDAEVQPFGIKSQSDGTIAFFGGRHDGPDKVVTQPLPTGQWFHLAAVYDSGNASIFVNGVMQDASNWGLPVLPVAGENRMLMLTDHHPAASVSGRYFYGYLDELILWDRPLSEAQIQSLYQEMAGGTLPDFRPPEEVGGLTVLPAENGLTFEWLSPEDAEGDLAAIRLYVDGNDQPIDLAPASTDFQLTGLAPLNNYHVRIATVDSSENETFGIAILATTLPLAPNDFGKPVSYWSMDHPGVNGNDVGDVCGRNHAIFDNVNVGQAGIAGMSVRKSSSSHRIEMEGNATLEPAETLSLALWIRPASNAQDEGGMLVYGTGDREVYGLHYRTDDGKHVAFRMDRPDGSMQLLRSPTRRSGTGRILQELETDQWSHVAAIFNRGTVQLFVNGELVAEEFWSESTTLSPEENAWLILGLNQVGTSRSYFGYLDEVLLFDRALSPAEVNLLRQHGHSGQTFHGEPFDLQPPETPSELVASSTSTGIEIGWSGTFATDLSHFHLYLGQEENPIVVASGQNHYELTGLEPFTLHGIQLASVDTAGNESVKTAIQATTLPTLVGDLPSPVSYWSMNTKDTNGAIFDVVGNNHSDFHSCLLDQEGIAGEAIRTYSSSHRVEIPASPSLDAVDRLTIAAWVYVTTPRIGGGIFSYGSATEEGFALTYQKDLGTSIAFQSGWPSNPHRIDTTIRVAGNGQVTSEFEDNHWHHVAAVFDHGEVSIFLDGSLSATASWSLDTLPLVEGRKLLFGRYTPGGNKLFSGYLDEFALWNQALSPEAINLLYWRGRRGESLLSSTSKALSFPISHGPDSYEDSKRIVLVNEYLELADFETSKELVLVNSRIKVASRLSVRSLMLREGSRILQDGGTELRIVAEDLIDVDSDSGFEINNLGVPLDEIGNDSLDFESDPLEDRPFGGSLSLDSKELRLHGEIRVQGETENPVGTVLIRTHRLIGDGRIDAGGDPGGLVWIQIVNEGDPARHQLQIHGREFYSGGVLPERTDRLEFGGKPGHWESGMGEFSTDFPLEAIEVLASDRMGSVLIVRSLQDLRRYRNHWIGQSGEYRRLASVVAFSEGRYLLRTNGALPLSRFGGALRLYSPVKTCDPPDADASIPNERRPQ